MIAILIIKKDDKTGQARAFAYGNTEEGTRSAYDAFMGGLEPYKYVGGYENPDTMLHLVRAYEVLKEEAEA